MGTSSVPIPPSSASASATSSAAWMSRSGDGDDGGVSDRMGTGTLDDLDLDRDKVDVDLRWRTAVLGNEVMSSASGVAATTSSPTVVGSMHDGGGSGVMLADGRAVRCAGVASVATSVSSPGLKDGRRVLGIFVDFVTSSSEGSRGDGAASSSWCGGTATRAMSASHSARSASSPAAPPASRASLSRAERAARSRSSLTSVAWMARSSPVDVSACVMPLAPTPASAGGTPSSSEGGGTCAGHAVAAQTLLGMTVWSVCPRMI